MDSPMCVFCDKLSSRQQLAEGEVVWEFPHSVALVGKWQFYRGYCVLVARRHATELSQLVDVERRAFLDELCQLARAIETAFRPHKLNYELLGNQVPHLHWHVFPRYAEDPEALQPVWIALHRAERDNQESIRLQGEHEMRSRTRELIREQLRAAGLLEAI